jgi:hypothetical protein
VSVFSVYKKDEYGRKTLHTAWWAVKQAEFCTRFEDDFEHLCFGVSRASHTSLHPGRSRSLHQWSRRLLTDRNIFPPHHSELTCHAQPLGWGGSIYFQKCLKGIVQQSLWATRMLQKALFLPIGNRVWGFLLPKLIKSRRPKIK